MPATIPFIFPGLPTVHCLFSTAQSGNMSFFADAGNPSVVLRNRARFMDAAGFSRWAEVHQVHGDVLAEAETGTGLAADALEKADGLYTFSGNVGLVVKTADCQPLLLTRDDGAAVAALHVGWRGNAMNFPGTAVRRLSELFSCPPDALMAVRGPSLGPAASEFVNFHDEWPAEFAPWFEPESRTVNLWRLTRRQLVEAGMRPDRIFSLDMCTRDMPGHFFSHRRRDAERQVGAIWMT